MKKMMKTITLVIFAFIASSISIVAQTKALTTQETKILILFHSGSGGTYKLAKAIARGVEQIPSAVGIIKQVPNIDTIGYTEWSSVPFASADELLNYDAIAFGSPNHFGNMSASMRYFLDQTVDLWTSGALHGVPATVFMSSGSGLGRETAITSFWNTLAIHGMILVPTGTMGLDKIDMNIPQGYTPFGTTSLASVSPKPRPSESELYLAELQGTQLAKIAKALKGTRITKNVEKSTNGLNKIEKKLNLLNITLPSPPSPVGNYKPYAISNGNIYINQVALSGGVVEKAGKIGKEVSVDEAKKATRQTMLNVIAVLKEACDGDLSRVVQCVQLSGYFCAIEGYSEHADLMNEASDLMVQIFGENGKHARGAFGVASLPLNSPVELQAIFQIK